MTRISLLLSAIVALVVISAGCITGQQVVQVSESSEIIVNGEISVGAGEMEFYQFSVPDNAQSARVTGMFAASGGTDNDIQVLILDEGSFFQWKKENSAPSIYDSGRATTQSFSIGIPAGTYYLVYSNKFSTFSIKGVKTKVDLTYQFSSSI